MALLVIHISAIWCSADSWAFLIGAKGVLGWGYFSVAIRSLAASVVALAEELAGMLYKCGVI